jgi:hypothetical protein
MTKFPAPKMFFLALLVSLLTTNNIPALNKNIQQVERAPEKQSIKICHAQITESGRTASFRFNYIASFSTSKNGAVENLKKFSWKGDESLLKTDSLIPCIKTWRLEPEKKFIVLLSFGTTHGSNSIQISNITDKKTFSIEL